MGVQGQWGLGLPVGLLPRLSREGAGPGAPSHVSACLLSSPLPGSESSLRLQLWCAIPCCAWKGARGDDVPQPRMQKWCRSWDEILAPARLLPALPTCPHSVPGGSLADPPIGSSCCSGETDSSDQELRVGAPSVGLTAGTALSTTPLRWPASWEGARSQDAQRVTRAVLEVPQAGPCASSSLVHVCAAAPLCSSAY